MFLFSIWRPRDGPFSREDLTKFYDKYLADNSWLITDGLTGAVSYVLAAESYKRIKLYQLSHNKGEFTRKQEHTSGPNGFIRKKKSWVPKESTEDGLM